MNKNKKGFTLIELMAVVIILIVVIFIAMRIIGDNVKDTETKAMIANAGSYIKAVNNFMEVESIGNVTYKNNVFTVSELENLGVKVTGTKPDSGILSIRERQVSSGCLVYGEYHVNYTDNNVEEPKKGSCDGNALAYTFDYTGGEQVFTVPVSGVYKLEAWGAQGGNYDNTYYGGYGGYSSVKVFLNRGEKLYINVGGAGLSTLSSETNAGGYNGGGDSYVITSSCSNFGGPGGGATSIATSSGNLSSVSESNIVIVAGGGGGAAYRYCSSSDRTASSGGSGGGYIGTESGEPSSVWTVVKSQGGSQSSGGTSGTVNGEPGGVSGTKGQGGATARTGGYTSGTGGGGGYYGGGNGMFVGAGGGSGFIGNYKTRDGIMYCYNCSESTAPFAETKKTTCSKASPEEKCAKKGNGYAKLTLVSEVNNLEDRKFLYSIGNEFSDITGGWIASNFEGNGLTEKTSGYLRLYYSSTNYSGSRFTTNNSIDMSGYSKLNFIYQITVVGNAYDDWGCFRYSIGHDNNWNNTLVTQYNSPGVYYAYADVSSYASEKVVLEDFSSDIRVLHVWLSN